MKPGHQRPLGTTWRCRMRWSGEHKPEPELDDVVIEDPPESLRAYRVVGIEEHRDSPRVWWLVLERIDHANCVIGAPDVWWFTRDSR